MARAVRAQATVTRAAKPPLTGPSSIEPKTGMMLMASRAQCKAGLSRPKMACTPKPRKNSRFSRAARRLWPG